MGLQRKLEMIVIIGSFSKPCFARFLPQDANRIDQEELLGVEYYNDIISYEYPVHWQRKWIKRDFGYRVSAGSFNDKRFYYKEDIKLFSPANEPFVISYEQRRREDLLEETRESQAKISFQHLDPLKISLLGDGDSYKKWGDVGVGLAYEQSKYRYIEFYYWSVDHYYKSKEGIVSDKYEEHTSTHGLRFFWDHLGPLKVEVNYEKDTPLVWYRESRAYTYEYGRSRGSASLAFPQDKWWQMKFSMNRDLKREAKQWNVTRFSELREELSYSKSMDRQVDLYSASLFLQLNHDEDVKLSVKKAYRDAQYDYFMGSEVLDYQIDEEESFDTKRNEWMLYGTWNFPVTEKQRTQLGFHCNQVDIENSHKPEEAVEVKTQFAWEWIAGDYGSVMLNTSWDIDQIARDVTDNPWGGGDIQLFMAF